MKGYSLLLIVIVAFILGFQLGHWHHANKVSNTENPSALSGHLQVITTRDTSLADHHPASPASATPQQSQQIPPENRLLLLQAHLSQTPQDKNAWRELAELYQQQGDLAKAQDAWFQHLEWEWDPLAREQAMTALYGILVELADTPPGNHHSPEWLVDRLERFLNLGGQEGGEPHLLLAELHLTLENPDQAQYHALMAGDYPESRTQAERLQARLQARLQGEDIIDTLKLPLTRLGAQFVVNAQVDGHPVRLLLDTGASISGLSDHYAVRYPALIRSTRPIRLNTASGQADSVMFSIDRMQLGPLNFTHQDLALLPMGEIREFDGLLGVDILGRFDFVIDQEAPALQLKPRVRQR